MILGLHFASQKQPRFLNILHQWIKCYMKFKITFGLLRYTFKLSALGFFILVVEADLALGLRKKEKNNLALPVQVSSHTTVILAFLVKRHNIATSPTQQKLAECLTRK